MNKNNTNPIHIKAPLKAAFINQYLLLVIALLVVFSSCTSHRRMVYLQHKNQITDTLTYHTTDHKIRQGDILYVRVVALDEEASAIFNKEAGQQAGAGGGNMALFLSGHTVNSEGEVILPVLGNVKLAGKTINEAVKEIERRVSDYLIGATVRVKLMNFSITVTGEVNSPGVFYVSESQISIIDALTMAGDLTDFGNRKVNIIRETDDGKGVTFAVLDITDPRSISSEYYFLQPNDLVYVEPKWVKQIQTIQLPLSVFLSAVTTVLLLINYVRN